MKYSTSKPYWHARQSAAEAELRKVQERIGPLPVPPDGKTYTAPQEAALMMENVRLAATIAHLRESLARAHRELEATAYEVASLRGELRRARIGQTPRSSNLPNWLQAHIRFLIFACHPDRNPNKKEEAEAVTKELLNLR